MVPIARVALLALAAMLVQSPTAAPAQGASGNVHFVNGHPAPDVIAICLGTETLAADLENGDTVDIELPTGNQAISVAVSPDTCADNAVPITGGVDVIGGGEATAILGPDPGEATQGVNDTSVTPPDTTRLTLRNGSTLELDFGICLDGELVDGTTVPGATTQAQAEVPSGPYDNITLDVPALNGCQTDDGQAVTLAACTNLVLNVYLTGDDPPANADNQLLIVGCELPAADGNVAAFCAVLPELQAVPDSLAALFANVDIDDDATYPSSDALMAFVDRVSALLATGDAIVPTTVQPPWLTATDGLRQLVAGLTAASFDFQTIVDNNPERAQEIIDGATGEGPPDPEREAAIDALTAFFLQNCLPAGVPPATPVEGVVRFTG